MGEEKLEIEKRTIEFILLGQAVPEDRRDHRTTQCTAGYSPTLKSLIRIYPWPADYKLNRWKLYEVDVERNPQDTRIESWKIQDSRSSNIEEKVRFIRQLSKPERIALIDEIVIDSCSVDLNEERLSLAVIKPEIIKAYLKDRKVPPGSDALQMRLNGSFKPRTGKSSDTELRIKYRCQNCKTKSPHDQHVLEYGVYTWFFKKPNNKEQVIDNLHLFDPEWDIHFLIGNLNTQRTSWMIICVIRWKK